MAEANLTIAEFIAALGLSGVVTVLVQILKRAGVVPDGQGGTVATLINVVFFVILTLAGTFGIDLEGPAAQQAFEIIAQAASLIGAILGSLITFNGLRGANVKGFRKGEPPSCC